MCFLAGVSTFFLLLLKAVHHPHSIVGNGCSKASIFFLHSPGTSRLHLRHGEGLRRRRTPCNLPHGPPQAHGRQPLPRPLDLAVPEARLDQFPDLRRALLRERRRLLVRLVEFEAGDSGRQESFEGFAGEIYFGVQGHRCWKDFSRRLARDGNGHERVSHF